MSRIVTTKHRCDLCTNEVTSSVTPVDWTQIDLKFDDGISDVPDVHSKHICGPCVIATVGALEKGGRIAVLADFDGLKKRYPEATR